MPASRQKLRTEEGRVVRKGRKEEDIAVKVDSGGALTWKCPACGAYNDDSEQVCADCTAIRAGALAVPQASEPAEIENIDWEAPSAESTAPEKPDEPKDENRIEEPQVVEPEIEPEQVISSPFTPYTPFTTLLPAAPATGQSRYFLVFVSSPAQSMIKSKVSIDFDIFPVISIGRNPENIVVIPDQEVSRKHAELTVDGTKLVLRDLKSKNGTYVYNGKQFEQVSDSVEVKPNSLLKFGTGTIVRLTSE